MNHKDPVDRVDLTLSEIALLRKGLRIRFVIFMLLAVILALISIYDHIMVKILMMFFLLILFWNFLKYHLRLKYDIEEGIKCVEEVNVGQLPEVQKGIFKRSMILTSAYGQIKLEVNSGETSPEANESVEVHYLPLSNRVIKWKRVLTG